MKEISFRIKVIFYILLFRDSLTVIISLLLVENTERVKIKVVLHGFYKPKHGNPCHLWQGVEDHLEMRLVENQR